MKKLLLLCACLLALASPLRAAAAPPKIIVVRIIEYSQVSSVVITRGEGKSEKVEFSRKATEVNEGYYKLFAKLYQQGYKLQSTFSAPMGTEGGNTTLLFVKAS
ncbi:MAG: hypothetical protein ACRYF0_18465 [Janthinobacterium lividum]